MSKERELLQKVVNHMWQGELVDEIKEVLAQPEQSSTTRHALDSYWNQEAYQRGYAEAELKLKREPLSFEDLNIMWCGNPIDFARRIESIHGIGVDNDN